VDVEADLDVDELVADHRIPRLHVVEVDPHYLWIAQRHALGIFHSLKRVARNNIPAPHPAALRHKVSKVSKVSKASKVSALV
jgi:hypothetical protein